MKDRENSVGIIKTTIEGLKITPNRSTCFLTFSTFFGLGGISELVITGNAKVAALSLLISTLSGGTTLVKGFADGSARLNSGEVGSESEVEEDEKRAI